MVWPHSAGCFGPGLVEEVMRAALLLITARACYDGRNVKIGSGRRTQCRHSFFYPAHYGAGTLNVVESLLTANHEQYRYSRGSRTFGTPRKGYFRHFGQRPASACRQLGADRRFCGGPEIVVKLLPYRPCSLNVESYVYARIFENET